MSVARSIVKKSCEIRPSLNHVFIVVRYSLYSGVAQGTTMSALLRIAGLTP